MAYKFSVKNYNVQSLPLNILLKYGIFLKDVIFFVASCLTPSSFATRTRWEVHLKLECNKITNLVAWELKQVWYSAIKNITLVSKRNLKFIFSYNMSTKEGLVAQKY